MISYLCSFVDVAISVHQLIVMTSMSGVVKLAFIKSPAVWDDFDIYTDTVGLVVTLQLAEIEVRNFYRCNDMFDQTFVTNYKLGWEKELTAFSLKDKSML